MSARRFLAGLAFSLLMVATTPAHAGRACEPHHLTPQAITLGLALGQHSEQALDNSGADVAVIARVGQDLSTYGLRYSHLGLAYRDAASGAWRIVHKLNQCGTDHASLYRQGLADFFMDAPVDYEAAVMPLSPVAVEALQPLLADNRRIATLDERHYSMLAYPWAQRYQQSNQWALETLAWAVEPRAATRVQAQAWLRLQGYQPATLQLSTLTRLGARLTAANIAFDDHPDARRFAGKIDTVTVESVFDFLHRSGLGGPLAVVR